MAFKSSTRIMLSTGWQKPIESLTDSDKVRGPNNSVHAVSGVLSTEHDGKLRTIQFAGMPIVTCTLDQKFSTPAGPVAAMDLVVGDSVNSTSGLMAVTMNDESDVVEDVHEISLAGAGSEFYAGSVLANV